MLYLESLRSHFDWVNLSTYAFARFEVLAAVDEG